MPEISLKDAGSSISKVAGAVTSNASYLKDGLAILKEVNSFMNSFNANPIIKRVFGGDAGSMIIQSGPGAKNLKNVTPQPTQEKLQDPQQKLGFSNDQVASYFSTPDGIKQIIGAIDQFAPILGENATIKDVRSLLAEAVGGGNVTQEGNKVNIKKGSSKKKTKKLPK